MKIPTAKKLKILFKPLKKTLKAGSVSEELPS